MRPCGWHGGRWKSGGREKKSPEGGGCEQSRDARALQKAAKHLPAARQEARRLQSEAAAALAQAEALELQARLEDLTVWKMEKVKRTRKGFKIYTYWGACWREGDRTRNVHLGSAGKMDAEAARRKARKMKAEALGGTSITAEPIESIL